MLSIPALSAVQGANLIGGGHLHQRDTPELRSVQKRQFGQDLDLGDEDGAADHQIATDVEESHSL